MTASDHATKPFKNILRERGHPYMTLGACRFFQRHHPSAEQLNASAAIHGSLEGLRFVDLPFGLRVAPRLRHGVPHRLQILAECPGKALHPVDPGRGRIDQPGLQPLRRSAAQQASKPHSQATHRRELGRRRFQRIDVGSLSGGHLTAGFDAKPAAVSGEITRPVIGSRVRMQTGAGSSCSGP